MSSGVRTDWPSCRTQLDQHLYRYLKWCFSGSKSRWKIATQLSHTKLTGWLLHLCVVWLADIVECAKVPPICGPYSNCTNSIGSYFCHCFHGFRLNKLAVMASYNNPCTGVCAHITLSLILLSYIFTIKCLTVFSLSNNRYRWVLWEPWYMW